MKQNTQHGYLVLADITGYTSYLAGVELTHAQDIMGELLSLLVERFSPLLSVAELEGDALFAHLPEQKIVRPETLLELLESTYLAFRDRREGISRRTTCQCNACRAIPTLDLKFIVHFGEYLVQSISGTRQLVGSDVNLAHRLLKNHVREVTGWKAYILLTGPALEALNLELANLHQLMEDYEHLGGITTHSLDLHARYEELRTERRGLLSPKEADFSFSGTVAAAPVAVWEWLNDPEKRLQWETGHVVKPLLRPGGRTGPGAQNHCAHGAEAVVETVLDWRPFTDFTTDTPMATWTHHLAATPRGAKLDIYARLKMPLPAPLRRVVAAYIIKKYHIQDSLYDLLRLVDEEAAREETARAAGKQTVGAGTAADTQADQG